MSALLATIRPLFRNSAKAALLLSASTFLWQQRDATAAFTMCEQPRTKRRKTTRFVTHQPFSTNPAIVHATLKVKPDAKILVIGDVHGCFRELMELHKTALAQEKLEKFDHVILVGDLVNKGPMSVKVIRHVQASKNWLAVRGNHDQAALYALQDEQKSQSKKYAWIHKLSQGDIDWLIDLPYTIRIVTDDDDSSSDSCTNLDDAGNSNQADIVIVHAGLVPNVDLADQSMEAMTTMRTILAVQDENNKDDGNNNDNKKQMYTPTKSDNAVPWIQVYRGPHFVIFGHDARRGLQKSKWALGLDTGCVYGRHLTGVVLPSKTLVQVKAKKDYTAASK